MTYIDIDALLYILVGEEKKIFISLVQLLTFEYFLSHQRVGAHMLKDSKRSR